MGEHAFPLTDSQNVVDIYVLKLFITFISIVIEGLREDWFANCVLNPL